MIEVWLLAVVSIGELLLNLARVPVVVVIAASCRVALQQAGCCPALCLVDVAAILLNLILLAVDAVGEHKQTHILSIHEYLHIVSACTTHRLWLLVHIVWFVECIPQVETYAVTHTCHIKIHRIQDPRVVVTDVQNLRLALLACAVVELEVVRLLGVAHSTCTTILDARLALEIFEVFLLGIGTLLGVENSEVTVHLWFILD